jgi:hypothetical protein
MKFSFQVDNSNLKLLALARNNLAKTDLFKQASIVRLFPDKKKLSIYFDGNTGFSVLTIDIMSLDYNKTDNKDLVYFLIKSDTFFNIILKLIALNIPYTDFQVDDDKVTIKTGKTKMSSTCYDASFNDNTVLDKADFINNMLKNDFKDKYEVLFTPEIMSFYDIAFTSMQRTAKHNSILIEDGTLHYNDYTVILQYKLEKDVTKAKDRIYVPYTLYDILKAYSHSKENVSFYISKDNHKAYFSIPELGIELMLNLPTINLEIPTKEDYENTLPTKDEFISFDIAKENLLPALEQFTGGIFDNTLWPWQQIRYNVTDELLKDNIILLNWGTFVASVETTVDIENIINKNTTPPMNFIIPSITIRKLMELLNDKDILNFTFNHLACTEQHGSGVQVKLKNYTVIFAKIAE